MHLLFFVMNSSHLRYHRGRSNMRSATSRNCNQRCDNQLRMEFDDAGVATTVNMA